MLAGVIKETLKKIWITREKIKRERGSVQAWTRASRGYIIRPSIVKVYIMISIITKYSPIHNKCAWIYFSNSILFSFDIFFPRFKAVY